MVRLVFRFSNFLLNKVNYVSIFTKDCDLAVVVASLG